MKPIKSILLLTICILLNVHTYAQTKELAASIKEHAHPLTTADPASNNADLLFLKEILKDKTIIGLGESTHGTHEIFTMKHRLLKFLVEEMGYRHFAMEANFAECLAINDYVLYGKGDPGIALRGIYFWTWNTVEVLDMIKWMRKYNEDKVDTDKVRFWGFDMQYTLGAAKAIIADLDYLKIEYGVYAAMLDSFATNKRYFVDADTTTRAMLLKQMTEFDKYASSYGDRFIKNTSEQAYNLHYQCINTLFQAIQKVNADQGYRDSCMAVNIKWLTSYTGTDKIVLWAHNGHINKHKISEGMSYYSMGYWLNKIYSDKYYAVGFDFSTGSFQAKEAKYVTSNNAGTIPLTIFKINKIRKGTSNYIFSKVGIPIFFLDYNTACKNEHVNTFLRNDIKTKVIGAIYWNKWEKSYYHTEKLKHLYDATIYMDKTTSAVPVKQ